MDITPEVDMSDYEQLGCLHEMFMKQAEKTPDAVAVVTVDYEKLTYREVNHLSDVLAGLLQKHGVALGTIVGILMDRSPEYVISTIAVHKAGGGYVPLEISYPLQLLNDVIMDVKPSVVLTKTKYLNRFKDESGNEIVKCIDLENWREVNTKDKPNSDLPLYTPVCVKLDDLAYAVYSSGSTGKPKGILCPHRGANFSYTWRHRAYPYQPDDREACSVFFIWEFLRPLIKGTPMYIIPDDVVYDPPRLAEFIRKFKITRVLFTPSLMQAVLEFKGLDLKMDFSSLRQLWFCGEVVTTALRDKVAELLPHIQLLNLYSISEAHDIANSDISKSLCSEPRKFCPVGKIMPLVHIVVMDDDQKLKKIGESGEIYIGGPTLAIGYLNRPDLNAEKFIQRPPSVNHEVGERLYRTGDWGNVLADGSLEICGRCDSAVRIRGYSVELQFVERTLLDLEEVHACCVVSHGEDGSDTKYLVAFIVLDSNYVQTSGRFEESNITYTRILRSKLKNRLSNYMIPSKFIYLDNIPIVAGSGKLDKKALIGKLDSREPDGCELDLQGQMLTETEMKVSKIWANALNLFSVDVRENFFDVGGHSLAATRLVSEINDIFNVSLTVRTVFDHPTIAAISAILDGNEACVKFELKNELKIHSQFIPSYNDLDIRLSAFWKSLKINNNEFKNATVLLTGATGFLGSHLLFELLVTTQCLIYCIVRDHPELDPLERIVNAQKQYALPQRKDAASRIIALKGDASLLNLGLPEDVYIALTFNIDIVLHASANVNLVLPYNALFKDNVEATKNIILFSLTNKIKFVNYISTNDVFPSGIKNCKEDDSMCNHVERLNTSRGYSQTKWLAEQLVNTAGKIGLPFVIYRCGNIAGSVRRPSWNPSDFILYMVQAVLFTKSAPEIDWQIELTPVDFVCSAIVKLSQDVNSSVGKTFHIINDALFNCRELWSIMTGIGYGLTSENYHKWLSKVSSHEKLAKLSNMLNYVAETKEYFSDQSTFCKHNLDVYLKKNGITYPEVNAELFTVYLQHLSELNLIPYPGSFLTTGVLHPVDELLGKVVLVTGASSGIGSAIASELALSGAKICIIGRRKDRLVRVRESLKQKGVSEIIALQVDVTDKQQVFDAVKEVELKWGHIDILVNNAGCMYYQLVKNCNLDEWHNMVSVNCTGSLNCLGAVIPSMVERENGHIVMITSDAGKKAFPGLSVYSGTKFFLEGLSSGMRMELSALGIKITCIQPGDVESEIGRLTTDAEAASIYDMTKKIKILKSSDIAKSVVYALSQPSYCAVNEILIEPRDAPS